MEKLRKLKLHPLLAGAAVAVILASAVGIAAMTGFLPGSEANVPPEGTAGAGGTAPQPASKPSRWPEIAMRICRDCGVVVDVKEVDVMGHGTGAGAAVGGVAGAVVGNQIGDHSRAATAVGAVGGAVLGHQIERSARSTKRYDVSVRMPDGSVKVVSSETQQGWKSGDKVKIREGRLVPI